MVPVAFQFGSHLTSKMHNSFYLGSSEKYGQAIMILPVDKRDVGDIYIHPDIKETVSRIYQSLDVRFNIISRLPEADDQVSGSRTELDVSVNNREQSISITVTVIGEDFIERIREIKSSHNEKYWTIQLILPVDGKSALTAYEELAGEGFFFTGVRALCNKREQIYMQYTGDVFFCFEEFKLTEGFQALLEEVLRYYRARRTVHTEEI